jgi:histidine triad (HIT) family protein
MDDCIFCKIVKGEAPSHTIWEDEKHIAFLSIFPNTEGTSVVIPKAHHTSYFAQLEPDVLTELMLAAQKVAMLLDSKLDDVGRTAMVFEGFGVDHIHAKLFPMHGTADMSEWRPIGSPMKTYIQVYDGYISSHDGPRADDAELADLAEKIRKQE